MGGFIIFTIMLILWGVTSLLAYAEVADAVKKIRHENDKKIVYIIFLLCGPAFAITTIANTILDNILPEGWDDDDNNNFINKY